MKDFILVLGIVGTLCSQPPDANDILGQIDSNLSAETMIVKSTMIIHGRRTDRSVTAKSWIHGTKKSFTEYLSPPREAGTKMLKLEDQLWIYSPQTDRIIRIAGHMLRQSVMGSDLSYEDLMEDPVLGNIYSAEIIEEQRVNDQPCWVLHLQAKTDDVAYATRKIWVDQSKMIILKENRYAKSGKLLKTTKVQEVMRQQGRWYPGKTVFNDVLSSSKGTEYVIKSIEFNADIPDYVFSKASLRK
ncbi:MAG: outer membrane lipoprotein-sorting protein [candidate division KSB1 bacterium]|nr:outer membrane lipoprotein-sorting protein [candidate division KSB1 bacterium]